MFLSIKAIEDKSGEQLSQKHDNTSRLVHPLWLWHKTCLSKMPTASLGVLSVPTSVLLPQNVFVWVTYREAINHCSAISHWSPQHSRKHPANKRQWIPVYKMQTRQKSTPYCKNLTLLQTLCLPLPASSCPWAGDDDGPSRAAYQSTSKPISAKLNWVSSQPLSSRSSLTWLVLPEAITDVWHKSFVWKGQQ